MLGQSAQEVAGGPARGRSAGGWRALVAGMLEGAATGLKGNIAQEKKAKAEKIGRFFDWLEGNALAMTERTQQMTAKRTAQEEVEPLLRDYAQNMSGLAPLAKEKYAAYILNRYNQRAGSDYALAAIDQVNPLKVAVTSPQTGKTAFIHDFSQQVGGVDAELYQKALDFEERKFNQDQARLSIAQQNAEAYASDIHSRWSPQMQFDVGLGKEGAKKLTEAVKKAEQENATLEDALYATKEAKEHLSTGKVIAGSDLGSYLQRLTGKAFNTDSMTLTQLYDTAAAQLYEFAKGKISFGNTNLREFEFLKDRIPESSKTPKALSMMLERFEKKIERKMARNDALISKMPDYSLSFEDRQEGGRQPPRQQGQQKRSQQLGMQGQSFKVRAPTGEIVLVPESDLEEAMAHGGTVVAS
jgi:hypothetical protein